VTVVQGCLNTTDSGYFPIALSTLQAILQSSRLIGICGITIKNVIFLRSFPSL